jgi:hypothetical protein
MGYARALRQSQPPRHRPRASRIARAPFFPKGEEFRPQGRGPASEATRAQRQPIMSNQELTPVAPQTVAKPPKTARQPRISKPLREAINLLANGTCKTQKAAAERAGLTEQHLSRMLNRAEIRAFVAQRSAENISRGVLRASARYVELIDAESEHVAAKVSERFLEHGGIIKPQQGNSVNVSISNNIAAGYVYDLQPIAPVVIDSASTPDKPKDE